MPEVELSAGPIEYEDTGGDGPVLVFLHGLTINGTIWRHMVADLRGDYRCVVPTWPIGGHRKPMNPGADLSLRGLALLIDEFLEKLELTDVTLVLNDWGGGQLLLSEGRADRVGRLVISSCEAFDNYPPGLPGVMIGIFCKIPGGLKLLMNLFRFKVFQRAPGAWSWMSKRAVPPEIIDGWFRPAQTDPAIRRDLLKYVKSLPSKETLLELADRMKTFERPVLVVWTPEDKVMPPEHGQRLVDLFPDARLVEIDDSYTLIPEDQPAAFTKALRDFVPLR
jgi:pimeloyl-ACP methyl ester carboxylesterase